MSKDNEWLTETSANLKPKLYWPQTTLGFKKARGFRKAQQTN